jgi:hypothetical protein
MGKRRPDVHNIKTMYATYVKRLLKDNPDYWALYSNKHQRTYTVYKKTERGVKEIMSYVRFKQIVITWFLKAQDRIIEGQALHLKSLGVIRAARVERNFNKKSINFIETNKQPKNELGKPTKVVYYDTPDWCRIRWEKPYDLTWIKVYEFSPMDSRKGLCGFKDKFREALKASPELQYLYPFIPFVK